MDGFGQMVAVAGVLALLAASLWWLRRHGMAGGRAGWLASRRLGGRPERRLECLERLPLGPQHTLHLVRLGETALLVASSPGGCALVHSFPCGDLENRR